MRGISKFPEILGKLSVRKQCVPGSFLPAHARETGNEAMMSPAWLVLRHFSLEVTPFFPLSCLSCKQWINKHSVGSELQLTQLQHIRASLFQCLATKRIWRALIRIQPLPNTCGRTAACWTPSFCCAPPSHLWKTCSSAGDCLHSPSAILQL